MNTKTQKTVAVTVFGVLLVAALGSFLLVSWKDGAGLVNTLRVVALVVSGLVGVYAAGLDAPAPRGPLLKDVADEPVNDGSDAFLPDGNVNRAAGSLGNQYLHLDDEK